jgi:hypothetical protein
MVDLYQGTVRVIEIVSESSGHLHYGPPKTKASRRTVGLPRTIVKDLVEHMSAVYSPDGYVFPAPKWRAASPGNLPSSYLAPGDPGGPSRRGSHP